MEMFATRKLSSTTSGQVVEFAIPYDIYETVGTAEVFLEPLTNVVDTIDRWYTEDPEYATIEVPSYMVRDAILHLREVLHYEDALCEYGQLWATPDNGSSIDVDALTGVKAERAFNTLQVINALCYQTQPQDAMQFVGNFPPMGWTNMPDVRDMSARELFFSLGWLVHGAVKSVKATGDWCRPDLFRGRGYNAIAESDISPDFVRCYKYLPQALDSTVSPRWPLFKTTGASHLEYKAGNVGLDIAALCQAGNVPGTHIDVSRNTAAVIFENRNGGLTAHEGLELRSVPRVWKKPDLPEN